jgi:uncharacterized membrane protein YraQ (UPF0718 family)
MIINFAKSIIIDFWGTVAEMSPYLLFGFFMAGILSVLVSQRLVEKHLGGGGIWPLLKASILGIPLPLCSCSVIPVSMSLRKHGASKGATISFLLSTPQTGVDSIFVTLSLLGPVITVFRPVVALVTGLVGGVLVDVFNRGEKGEGQTPQQCSDECCAAGTVSSRAFRGLKYGFVTLPRDIGKAMLVGLVIAALISTVVPDDFFAEKLLGTGIFAMLVMMFLGIPVYVCATASVPIAAALILKGVTPGAALVFLITGPATNAAGLTTIWKVLGGRTAIAYLFTVVVCAMGSGLLLDMTFPELGSSVQAHVHQMEPSVLGHISAIALLAVLAIAILRTKKPADQTQHKHW